MTGFPRGNLVAGSSRGGRRPVKAHTLNSHALRRRELSLFLLEMTRIDGLLTNTGAGRLAGDGRTVIHTAVDGHFCRGRPNHAGLRTLSKLSTVMFLLPCSGQHGQIPCLFDPEAHQSRCSPHMILDGWCSLCIESPNMEAAAQRRCDNFPGTYRRVRDPLTALRQAWTMSISEARS